VAGKREENGWGGNSPGVARGYYLSPRWGWEVAWLRKTLAEHPFGTIKRWFGYTHFLLKGLTKVQCEWSLTTLAYNLKRVLNLVSFEKLMSTLRSFTAEDGAAVG
jgi:hypothetical protein